LTKLTINSIAS